MVHHGLSTREALNAATRTAAGRSGSSSSSGRSSRGSWPISIVVDGNVLGEPALFLDRSRISMVLQLGELVAGSALEANGGVRG